MKIDIQIEIPDELAVRLIRDAGYEIFENDFGNWRSDRVWVQDNQAAVKIDNEIYSIKTAFERLFKYKLNSGIMALINELIPD